MYDKLCDELTVRWIASILYFYHPWFSRFLWCVVLYTWVLSFLVKCIILWEVFHTDYSRLHVGYVQNVVWKCNFPIIILGSNSWNLMIPKPSNDPMMGFTNPPPWRSQPCIPIQHNFVYNILSTTLRNKVRIWDEKLPTYTYKCDNTSSCWLVLSKKWAIFKRGREYYWPSKVSTKVKWSYSVVSEYETIGLHIDCTYMYISHDTIVYWYEGPGLGIWIESPRLLEYQTGCY